MNEEFLAKLKETLENIDTRLRQLEHLTNEVIIGSLESAANEYADNEAFETFKGNYGESLKDLVGPYKKLFGEDYDLERSLYDDLKATEGYGSEGFDEAGCMAARIEDLKARIDAIKDEVKEVAEEAKVEDEKVEDEKDNKDKEEVEVVEENTLPDDETLAKELKDAMAEGVA